MTKYLVNLNLEIVTEAETKEDAKRNISQVIVDLPLQDVIILGRSVREVRE